MSVWRRLTNVARGKLLIWQQGTPHPDLNPAEMRLRSGAPSAGSAPASGLQGEAPEEAPEVAPEEAPEEVIRRSPRPRRL